VVYEIACDLYKSQIVWINGPFQAGINDVKVFRTDFKSMIPEGKKVIADRGYNGELPILSVPNDYDSDEVKDFKSRARARQETINKRLKDFAPLAERFRHGFDKHGCVFNAVAVIVQIEMDNGQKMFDI
jgi:hypothetical protein